MKNNLLLFIIVGLAVLSNSCSSDDSGNNQQNNISMKINGVKKGIPMMFVTEESGTVSVNVDYISFDYPTENVKLEMNTTGTHLTHMSYDGYLGLGTFESGSSFISSITTDTSKRTIRGTMSGTLHSSESGQNLSITNGSFFIHY